MRTFKKQPNEIFDYDLDYSEWFDERDDSDQIESLEISCDPAFGTVGGLLRGSELDEPRPDTVLVPGYNSRNMIGKVWIGGGTSGEEYIVTVKVHTEMGRLDEVEFRVSVKETPE